jgi:tRNA-modifying protein YgfZ
MVNPGTPLPGGSRWSMSEFDLSLDRERLTQVRHGAVLVTTQPAVFRVHGPGALACLQGLLTNDLVKPGDNSLVYGALLTPKGAVVVDYWVLREPGGITLVAPRSGHEASLDLFRRQLPPRLAKVSDMTGQASVAWLIGAHGFQTLASSGVSIPEATGRVASIGGEVSPVALGLAPETAPFVALAVGAEPAISALGAKLVAAGALQGDEGDLHAARILCGWPALGAEIDERTLPQEVRYDQIGGVSYTKGCYTGQETVARLHFRGHTNRELRGLRWRRPQPLDSRSIQKGEREVGSVRSTLSLEDRAIGLGLIRREVEVGEELVAGGQPATVVALPFGPEDLDG